MLDSHLLTGGNLTATLQLGGMLYIQSQMKFSSHYIRLILAFIVYISAMGYVFAASFLTIPTENQRTIDTAIGFAFGIVTSVASYYFGSSQGSADKDKRNNGSL